MDIQIGPLGIFLRIFWNINYASGGKGMTISLNTGNPNKGQRYTLGWAEALETIAECRPRIVVPGHGDPLKGDHALEVLGETARALRYLHDAVLERLNSGLWPDEVVDQDVIELSLGIDSCIRRAETWLGEQ